MKKLKIMNRLILLLTVFVASNVSALTSAIPDDSKRSSLKTVEQLNFEAILFEAPETTYDILDVNDIEIVEVEEEVDLGFDPKQYLPEGFNALEAMAKGKVVFTGAEKEWLDYHNLKEDHNHFEMVVKQTKNHSNNIILIS